MTEGAPRLESGGFLYLGKGVVDCGARKILAWNMDVADETGRGDGSGAVRPEKMGPCPAPTGRERGDAIVACAS